MVILLPSVDRLCYGFSPHRSGDWHNKNKRIISSKFWLWLKNNLYEIDANKIAFLITQSSFISQQI